MNSRAASAASSRRVKQELVRLLFGQESLSATSSTKTGVSCRSQQLDHSIYSYADLRSAYLEQLQKLHPDKAHHTKYTSTSSYQQRQELFVQLQDAWDQYDQMAKLAQKVDHDQSHKNKNFVLFGVGCSFSDNEQERKLRDEITDQACRGWFSAGAIDAVATTSTSTSTTSQDKATKHSVSMLEDDDDMFVTVTEQEKNNTTSTDPPPRRTSLVDKRFQPRSSAPT